MAATSVSHQITGGDTGTRRLVTCGVVAGPLFIGASLIQAFTRDGFSLNRHAVSLLLLGDNGWIQFATFVVTGLLAVAFAAGVRRLRHNTWAPLLIGTYGVLFIAAGCCKPDPADGFPPGTPGGAAATMSWHAGLHSLAFFGLVLAVIVACFGYARQFRARNQRAWARYCAATGLGTPVLLVAGMALSATGNGGIPLLGVAVATSAWLTAMAVRLRTQA
ncbi:DUF998 domain-containing protein [Dactylosporangium siamense]|uniref:DUF998 domain-containing protein n=1 Tax=Dactylosporangium siamense TaxID=685454 RepID=A0A919PKI8_9ACTN|nr:DUF998 domain-containing protein [Dactylosporangium siamense]GIG43698.1 hypothetical protein Dsi01nite_017390 [Dactylosporangium siamense]